MLIECALCVAAGIICASMFLLSFPFVLGNGVYLFQLMDQFSVTFPLLLIGFFEFIAIGWVIGVKKLETFCVLSVCRLSSLLQSLILPVSSSRVCYTEALLSKQLCYWSIVEVRYFSSILFLFLSYPLSPAPSLTPTPSSVAHSFFNNITTKRIGPRMIIFWTVMWKYVTPIVMIIIFMGAMITELINPLEYVSYDAVSPSLVWWMSFRKNCIASHFIYSSVFSKLYISFQF